MMYNLRLFEPVSSSVLQANRNKDRRINPLNVQESASLEKRQRLAEH